MGPRLLAIMSCRSENISDASPRSESVISSLRFRRLSRWSTIVPPLIKGHVPLGEVTRLQAVEIFSF